MVTRTLAEHADLVAGVARAVKEAARAGAVPVHVNKGGVHHVVPLPGDRRFSTRAIDVGQLRAVVSVDAQARTCVAEPGATFGEILDATLPLGLAPLVVPELEGITIGGAVSGCSVESMSYRVGGFHDTCLEYEVVTGAGDVLTCSPTEDAAAFEMIHGSYGTLGILTLVTFRLVPAAPFVRMEYLRFDDLASFERELLRRVNDAPDEQDFVDAIAHSPNEIVLCLGHFDDEASRLRQPSDYRHARIYYRSTLGLSSDVLATRDYYFRYDTECHWLTRTVPPLEWPWVRRLVGRWFLGSTNLITWSQRLARVLDLKRRPDVVCDVFVPSGRFREFFEWYARDFAFWPLWIVPYRMRAPYPWITDSLAARFGGDLFIDCAVYGAPNRRRDLDLSVDLEQRVFELDGLKTLIGRNHYSEDRFWEVYDRPRIDAAKSRLDPDGTFRGLYEKLGRVD